MKKVNFGLIVSILVIVGFIAFMKLALPKAISFGDFETDLKTLSDGETSSGEFLCVGTLKGFSMSTYLEMISDIKKRKLLLEQRSDGYLYKGLVDGDNDFESMRLILRSGHVVPESVI